MTKSDRELREYKAVFADERFAKTAWKQLIGTALEGSAKALPETYDPKTGERTFQSSLDQMAFDNVKVRLLELGLDRDPQQCEVIVESNILRARFSDTTFGTILDRTAGKVKEEVTINKSPFEELSDDELEMIATLRKSKESNEQKE